MVVRFVDVGMKDDEKALGNITIGRTAFAFALKDAQGVASGPHLTGSRPKNKRDNYLTRASGIELRLNYQITADGEVGTNLINYFYDYENSRIVTESEIPRQPQISRRNIKPKKLATV